MAKDIYVDTYGRSHVASKVLSSGGQGIVYLTEEPNVLLKLEWNPMTQEIEKDTSNFTDVREYKLNSSADDIKGCCGIYHEDVRWHGVI